jgi:RNA polymerase sigma-70 factor (ECF subfamily)
MSDARSEHDAQLAACFTRGAAGDAASYREFLLMLDIMLRGYFRKRLTDRAADVDDLVQEALLAVHHRRHTFRGAVPITAWVHAIARHKFLDLLRADASRAALFEPMEPHTDAAADNALDAWLAKRELQGLLSMLPPKQRQAIEAVKLQGLTVAEVALTTGATSAAIKVSVHRGLRALASRCGAPAAAAALRTSGGDGGLAPT